jgi:hypothetical protein
MLSELRESSVRRLFFYDVPDAKELFEQFQEEMRRRAELEKQMSMVHENPEPVGGSGAPQPQAGIAQQPQVSAEEQRAKLEAQRKARRKM